MFFGKNGYAIHATPPDLSYTRAKEVLIELIEHYKNTEGSIREKMKERVVLALAKASAISYNTALSCEEMNEMTGNLLPVNIIISLQTAKRSSTF